MSTQAKPQKDRKAVTAGPLRLNLQRARDLVKDKGTHINVNKDKTYSFKVGALSETSYRDTPEMLEEWEEFYLPDQVSMEVIGVLEEFYWESTTNELVLMVCEDGKVYGYANNTLHLVTNSLEDLFNDGVQFPGIKEYYRGQRFEDMTEEDWDEVKASEEVRKMMKEHRQTLECMETSYLNNLDNIMGISSGEPRNKGHPASLVV